MTPTIRKAGTAGLLRVALLAATLGATAVPTIATASDPSTVAVDVAVTCDTRTHCAGTLPDGARLDCVVQDSRWVCDTRDNRVVYADTAELDRYLSANGGEPSEGAPVLPKFKVKVAIRVRPTGG